MLKKEWRDILLPVLLRLLIGPLLAILQAILAAEVSETTALLLFFGLAVSVLWVALYLGLNAFHGEFQDHALEYWLTFPKPFCRKLLEKFIVRLAVLAFLLGLYCLYLDVLKNMLNLPHHMVRSPFFGAGNFSLWVLFYYGIGFFLSLVDWKSIRPLVPLLILVFHSLLAFLLEKTFGYAGSEVCGVLLLLATGTIFWVFISRLRRGVLGNGWRMRRQTPEKTKVPLKNDRGWGILRHELRIAARHFLFQALFIPVLGYISGWVSVVSAGGTHGPIDALARYVFAAFMFLVLIAFDQGCKLFEAEFRQKALEYLLTFPLGFRRVLGEKLLARILVLLPATIALMILTGHFSERLSQALGPLALPLRPALLPFWVALMLLSGLFLSLFEMKNVMALVSLANMVTIVLVPLALSRLLRHSALVVHAPVLNAFVIGSGLLLTTLALAVAFSWLLPRFDLAAPGRYSRAFGLFLFITFTSVSLASLGILLFI